MKKALVILMVFFIASAFLFALGQTENSAQEEKIILRYADNQPDDYPTTLAAKRLSQLIEERTEGRICIEVFCSGVLGDEKSIIEQIRFGGMDMARVSLSPWLSSFHS